MNFFRTIVFTLAAFAVVSLVPGLSFVGTAQAEEITTFASAINKAGRQRMLSQRIVRMYAQIGQGVRLNDAETELQKAVDLFDQQLSELIAFTPTSEIRAALAKVETLWTPFRALAVRRPVSKATAQLLLSSDGELLAAAHEVVLLLEKAAGTSYSRLVNISGRQRMLSQRIAKFYLMRSWGVDDSTIVPEMNRARIEFVTALEELNLAPENTPEISAALEDVKENWGVFDVSVRLDRESKEFIPLLIAVSAEKILKQMDTITGMYEALSAR